MNYWWIAGVAIFLCGLYFREKEVREYIERLQRQQEACMSNVEFHKRYAEKYKHVISALVAGGLDYGTSSQDVAAAESSLAEFATRLKSLPFSIDGISEHYAAARKSLAIAADYVESRKA